jgi:hypothetical protein
MGVRYHDRLDNRIYRVYEAAFNNRRACGAFALRCGTSRVQKARASTDCQAKKTKAEGLKLNCYFNNKKELPRGNSFFNFDFGDKEKL